MAVKSRATALKVHFAQESELLETANIPEPGLEYLLPVRQAFIARWSIATDTAFIGIQDISQFRRRYALKPEGGLSSPRLHRTISGSAEPVHSKKQRRTEMTDKASTTPTRFADLQDRKIAYRRFGAGRPLVLNIRFRGTMDSWDPLFLDELAKNFEVIIYDYSGLGASTGNPTYDRASLVKDAKDLVDFLGLEKVVIGGWSLGGVVAQKFTATHPELVSHTVLIGTAPPGKPEVSGERLFMETAMHSHNGLDDQIILFFEPTSERSKEAARRSVERIDSRTNDVSPNIPETVFMKLLSEAKDRTTIYPDPDGVEMAKLAAGGTPVLVVSGDHDIACPIGNWLTLTTKWKSLHLLAIPQAGHGPHHQEPLFCAETVTSFVDNI